MRGGLLEGRLPFESHILDLAMKVGISAPFGGTHRCLRCDAYSQKSERGEDLRHVPTWGGCPNLLSSWRSQCDHKGRSWVENQDIDPLGWTDREFSCLHAILDHKRKGHQGEPCAGD
jgi:hypothetical protein